jgi:hypothetical protein
MPGKSPQRLAKLAKANAARNPPLTTEYNDLEPHFPGAPAAARSTILELMDSKGFTQENAEKSVRRFLFCYRLDALHMQARMNRKDEAVWRMVGGIFFKHLPHGPVGPKHV